MDGVTVQEKCVIQKTKSRESVQNKHMFSKFLYYRFIVCLSDLCIL